MPLVLLFLWSSCSLPPATSQACPLYCTTCFPGWQLLMLSPPRRLTLPPCRSLTLWAPFCRLSQNGASFPQSTRPHSLLWFLHLAEIKWHIAGAWHIVSPPSNLFSSCEIYLIINVLLESNYFSLIVWFFKRFTFRYDLFMYDQFLIFFSSRRKSMRELD